MRTQGIIPFLASLKIVTVESDNNSPSWRAVSAVREVATWLDNEPSANRADSTPENREHGVLHQRPLFIIGTGVEFGLCLDLPIAIGCLFHGQVVRRYRLKGCESG